MAECDNCGNSIDTLSFTCKGCSGTFCTNCRLPENHNCVHHYKFSPPHQKWFNPIYKNRRGLSFSPKKEKWQKRSGKSKNRFQQERISTPAEPNIRSSSKSSGPRLSQVLLIILLLGIVIGGGTIAGLVFFDNYSNSIGIGDVGDDGVIIGNDTSEHDDSNNDETLIEPDEVENGDSDPSIDSELNNTYIERELFGEIVAYRLDNRISGLTWNSNLAQIAREHSNDMIERGFFDHINPDGEAPWDRSQPFCDAGENIVMVPTPARIEINDSVYRVEFDNEVVSAAFLLWKNSPGHNENMLDEQWSEAGIGVAYADDAEELYITLKLC